MEIQTRQFEKIRDKLAAFLTVSAVTVVYPVAAVRWICWVDKTTGEVVSRRKSPKIGAVLEIGPELYRIRSLLTHPCLSFCIIRVDVEEYRYLDGWSTDRKKGATRVDRMPLSLREEMILHDRKDYGCLLPDMLPACFTTEDYRKASRLSRKASWMSLSALTALDVVRRAGKRGRSDLYRRVDC
jgi:hypothetical protein